MPYLQVSMYGNEWQVMVQGSVHHPTSVTQYNMIPTGDHFCVYIDKPSDSP